MIGGAPDQSIAFTLNGNGQGEQIKRLNDMPDPKNGGFIWIHLDQSNPEHATWLRTHTQLSSAMIDILLQDVAKAYASSIGDALVIGFKGLNADAPVEQLSFLSTHIVLTENRIITLCHGTIHGLVNINAMVQLGQAPRNTITFLLALFSSYITNLTTIINQIDTRLEAHVLKPLSLHELTALKQQLLHIKRHVHANVDLYKSISTSWISEESRLAITYMRSRIHQIHDDIGYLLERIQLLLTTHNQESFKKDLKKSRWMFYALFAIAVGSICYSIVLS